MGRTWGCSDGCQSRAEGLGVECTHAWRLRSWEGSGFRAPHSTGQQSPQSAFIVLLPPVASREPQDVLTGSVFVCFERKARL